MKCKKVASTHQNINKKIVKNFVENFSSLFLQSEKNGKDLRNKSESSSFGRARPCQGRGGQFEPGLSLEKYSIVRWNFFWKPWWWNW